MWSNLGIRQKVFALFTIIALAPLIVVNVIWLRSSQSQLKQAAANRQNILLTSSAQRVNDALDAKINSIVTHSQDSNVTNLNIAEAKLNLSQLATQDSDILRIALIDSNGNEQIVIKNREFSQTLNNVKSSDAFKVVSQISNDASVSALTYDNGQPKVTITVPLLSSNKLGDQNLTNAEALARRYGSDIKGALSVDVSLNNLWQSILSAKIGNGGYAYIVDAQGKLIGHPDANFIKTYPDLSKNQEVTKFLKLPGGISTSTTTLSEKGVQVFSQHALIKRTGWAIVAEEPIASIFAPANQIAKLAIFIFVIAGVASMLLSLLFSRNLTRPIQKLVTGTSQLAEGDLDMRIAIKSTDEIGVLADRFNAMAASLKQLVSNLRTESTKLNVVLDNVGEGILALDVGNKIVLANISAAVIAGTLPSDLLGKPLEIAFELTKNNQPFHLNLESTEVYKVYKEVVFISPNKRLHYLDIFINKIVGDPNGIKTIITFRDQTDERELEMMKLDFVSMAAHELRTPITAIRGYLGLLTADEKANLSDDSKQSLERAQSSAVELVGLISNLLNVSKIERGTLNMHYSKINWVKTIQDAIHDHEFTAAEKHIQIHYEGPIDEVLLAADEISIKEVINNLLSNALNYTDKNGNVTVGIRIEGKNVITYVKDSGIGIPANALKHLFTKFYRVKGGLASGSGGTGLGLFISKSIVELHKGRISVESEYGKGSTFTVSLPAYDEQQYQELANKEDEGVKKHRGWVTKNTTR